MCSSILAVLLLALNFYSCFAQTNGRNSTFQVGIILDLDSLVGRMGMTSLSLAASDFYSVQRNTELVLHVRDSNGRVIDAAGSALNLLKDVEVDAIIGPQKSAQASFVIGLGDTANVPVISFSATSPFHPESKYFLQAAMEDSYQVGAIASVVEYFKWTQVVVITEESDHGNDIVPFLMNAFQDVNIQISHRSVIPVAESDDYILKELYKMKTMQTRVFVVHMSSTRASKLFLKANEAGMMTKGYAWIVTSGLMDLFYSLDSQVIESMDGVIGVKPLVRKSERLNSVAKRWRSQFLNDNLDFTQTEMSLYAIWAYDAMWALSMAAEKVRFREQGSLQKSSIFINSTNPFTGQVSKTGPKLRDAMSEITFEGLGGNFRLVDEHLQPSFFQILNVVGNSEREVGIWTKSQGILMQTEGNISTSNLRVMFPGNTTDVPKGWELPVSGKKLRIGVPPKAGFPEFIKVDKDPKTNASRVTGCFKDMFDAVMKELPYAADYEYFSFEDVGGTSLDSYDGFSHQVQLQNYDGAVGDISITSQRSEYVDFTFPFTQGGVIVIAKRTQSNKWFFIKPFEGNLWFSVIALFIYTGIALWILEHRFNDAYRGTPANHAPMIFYVPFMSMVCSQTEKVVNNLARVVIVVWMFVVLMLTSTYTANLSTYLTVQSLQGKYVLNKNDYVGCRKGSFIYDLLQKDIGYNVSRIRNYTEAEDIDEALTNGPTKGGISAFYAVKPYADVFLSKYGNKYWTVGDTYPNGGYAFVFAKGSPLVADVSRAVIQLTERGVLSKIEAQLKKPQNNKEQDLKGFEAIPLKNFYGLFAITGTVTTTCVLIFLAMYLYENQEFITQISNSHSTILSKLRDISKNFDQKDPKWFRSSMVREDHEDNTSPRRGENPGPSTVVPVSSTEINDAIEVGSPISEHAASIGQTR